MEAIMLQWRQHLFPHIKICECPDGCVLLLRHVQGKESWRWSVSRASDLLTDTYGSCASEDEAREAAEASWMDRHTSHELAAMLSASGIASGTGSAR
jgi:uncharacterized membrane protein YccC